MKYLSAAEAKKRKHDNPESIIHPSLWFGKQTLSWMQVGTWDFILETQ